VVLTEKVSSNIEKKEYEQQSAICHHIPSCAQFSLSAFIIPLGVMVTFSLSQRDVGSRIYIFQIFGFSESQDGLFFEYFVQFWVFLYGCPVLTNDGVYITERRMVCDDKWHSVVRILLEPTSLCDKLKVTITPSGMIKADRERKVSGLKNSRSCHRM
jgi:hypothetical protein